MLVGVAVLAGSALGSRAPQGPNLWAGDWNTSDGTVGWRLMNAEQVGNAKTAVGHAELYDKLPCKDGPQFYEGGYVATDRGKVIACGTPTEIEGRWLSEDHSTNHGSFTLMINSQPPHALTFTGTARTDGGAPFKWTGTWTGDFGGDGATTPFVVSFAVIAKGKPNIPIRVAPGRATLVYAKLGGSGHATFTKNRGDLLEATETKGKVTLDETFSDGKTEHLVLGVQSHTLYSPANNRLALVLDVTRSTDPDCPAEGIRIATLNLLPTHQGVRDVAIFFGLPYQLKIPGIPIIGTLTTDACKGGHVYGWENGSGRVFVRVRLTPMSGS